MPTKRQEQIVKFMKEYSTKHGVSPSIEEMGRHFKRSVSTIHEHLQKLRAVGRLEKLPGRARSLSVRETEPMIQIPLLGTITAGQPIEAIQQKETVAVPKSKVPRQGTLFALRVNGESMKDENINDGDVIIVKQQSTAENGDRVVALIDNTETTLKKFYKERGQVRLQPANKNFDPILVDKNREFSIQGVVVDVIEKEGGFLKPPVISRERNERETQLQVSTKPTQWISGNLEFYLGDSLQVLKTINRKYTTIYLDPPFNSSRNYKYAAQDDEYTFADTWGDGEYEVWLDNLIGSCKSRLQENGTLFFHISAELSFIPEKVLRKHFKKVEPIFWKKAHGKNTVKNKLGAVIDVIIKASNNGSKFNLLHVPLDEFYFEHSYTNKDEVGLYALGSIKHDKTRSGHYYKIERNGIIYEAPYGWKIPKNKLDELLKQNRIHYGRPRKGTNQGMLYKKLYKHECKGKPLSNLWDDIAYITRTTRDERYYPTQKPLNLLKRIIELSSNKNDWILDPVAGSGTTGIAAIALGRKVTLIDNNKEAERAVRLRLKKIGRVEKG